jgi:hypothetical protein
MTGLQQHLLDAAQVQGDPAAVALVPIVTSETGISSAGFPFLNARAFARFRDTVPHVLGAGGVAWRAVDVLERVGADADIDDLERLGLARGLRVVRTVLRTAAVTAPPDLWLLRQVLGAHRGLGLLGPLLDGGEIDPHHCVVETPTGERTLKPSELEADLDFLVARGLLTVGGGRYAAREQPRARRVLEDLPATAPDAGFDTIALWGRAFSGAPLSALEASALEALGTFDIPSSRCPAYTWIASLEEIELGYRLLPVVLGLRIAGLTAALSKGEAPDLPAARSTLHAVAQRILAASGALLGGGWEPTPLGERLFARGPGPFGIIGAYHGYTARLRQLLLEGRGNVWVERGANVAASQEANRRTFERANDALDRFCSDTGFEFQIFIEHAVGRGEATRQRALRSGDDPIQFIGADLEEAAIAAAREERAQGHLPENMLFISGADIGDPSAVIDYLRARGLDTQGAVMLVGNGFHEVRNQTDERMVEVFRGYHDAGLLLLFTEESALSTEDLLKTAWNTYHAGFRYVHAKSGQGLRPAVTGPPPRFGKALPASWTECAARAGYIRAEAYCHRGRTIYPYAMASRPNPAVSVSHFVVPRPLAQRLGLIDEAAQSAP